MSDSPEELGRRLFASVRRERPSAELRARVLEHGRAERARLGGGLAQRAPLRGWLTAFWTKSRLGWTLALAAGAALVFAIVRGDERPGIVMSAEQSRDPVGTATTPARADEPGAPRRAEGQEQPTVSRSSGGSNPERAARPKKPAGALSGSRMDAGPARPEARSSLAEQLEQIRSARAALRAGDPVQALALLDVYETRSSGGELAAEASLLRIEALAASGRRAEAARLAREFAVDHPNSPLIDRALTFARQ